ncbi:APC membrane recruitment protein 1 [Callorhinchus milii]|uniref:APC membrane recruitment protein 1 n=1 Tax=Callorhinchus milii TaxID=7868 RepID=UPI001C3F87CA|nr:APC membrane recruitment protein 1 [Callorhinchus milii]
METGGRGETAGTKALSAGRGEVAGGNQAQGTAVDAPSECTDATVAEQSSGKLKKTAFKLFGGRKSICTLPSFFTAKNKGQGKGSSRKGISKSKTHDGISEAGHGNRQKEGSERCADNLSSGDTNSPGRSFPAGRSLCISRSEHTALDPCVKSDLLKGEALQPQNPEGFVQKRSADKSLAAGRSKKGLRGLFNSIRRHKKNKAADSVKEEPLELQLDSKQPDVDVAHGEQVTVDPCSVRAEFKKDLAEESMLQASCKMNSSGTSDPANRTGATSYGNSPPEPHALKARPGHALKTKTRDFRSSGTEVRAAHLGEVQTSHSGKAGAAALHMNFSCGSMPDIVKPEYTDHDPSSGHSFDQISLAFGDVTSLKSFDSLTGCGDIIADHDDDSLAESTMSGERGRAGAKRSSCLVTYQGGGEEMATPDEVDDTYLRELWEKAAPAATNYDSGRHAVEDDSDDLLLSPSEHECSGLHISLADPGIPRGIADSAINSSELVTPQSDHQESAPNSDEGYYDSTTPGHDEEGGDTIGQSQKERLPRDSYSGDALYELFVEPDDSLTTSPPSDETSFETKSPPFESMFPPFSSYAARGDRDAAFSAEREKYLADHQARWQPNAKNPQPKKGSGFKEKEKFPSELYEAEFDRKVDLGTVHLMAKMQQVYASVEPLASHTSSRRAKAKDHYFPDAVDEQNWSGLQGVSCLREPDHKHAGSRQSAHGSHSCGRVHSKLAAAANGGYESNGEKRRSQLAEKSGSTQDKCEQAISYSQALVEFTANRKLFPNLSETLGSSESSSSFTQNIHALPTMVTFDVVDVENEGECDQQSEMVTDEEISASYEAFDDNYHDCDDRILQMGAQNPFLGNAWGATSLPRHVNLYKLGPSSPAPLSYNRRSRSLDTDSLESELTDLYLSKVTAVSKSTPQSPEASPCERDGRKASTLYWLGSCKRNCQAGSLESGENTSSPNRSGLKLAKYKDVPLSPRRKRNSSSPRSFCPPDTAAGEQHTVGRVEDSGLRYKPNGVKPPTQSQSTFKRTPEGATNTVPQNPRKMVRPSHLPLQNEPCRMQPVTGVISFSRENTNGKVACISPLKEKQEGVFYKTSTASQYSDSDFQVKKCKPAGIPQVVSPFHANSAESVKCTAHSSGHYGTANSSMFKGRGNLAMKVPVGWNQNTTMDV